VKLYGRIRSWLKKDAAEEAAWSAPGVAWVENFIEVVPVIAFSRVHGCCGLTAEPHVVAPTRK